jgi:citronellyl-CoA dehydrogenase
MGYMWESPVARLYRDGRLASIGGGADEIMLTIIAKLDGWMPKPKKSGEAR